MVKETLQFQGIRTNKELRDEYKNRKENKSWLNLNFTNCV
jgi:hypothetical protein